jgi:hypothetical protein
MKELFKKVFSEKTSSPIFVGFGVFAIFTFIVFPGLTASSTALNLFSSALAIFTLVFVYYYLRVDKIYENFTHVEPGETELDYIPKEDIELVNKKKRTRKPEFPIEPHRKTVKKSNTKQFDGVKSEEPFVKTRTNNKTK